MILVFLCTVLTFFGFLLLMNASHNLSVSEVMVVLLWGVGTVLLSGFFLYESFTLHEFSFQTLILVLALLTNGAAVWICMEMLFYEG